MKTYRLHHHRGTTFVLTEPKPRSKGEPTSDFLGTGMALTGIANEFETFDEVVARFEATHERNLEANSKESKQKQYVPKGTPQGRPKIANPKGAYVKIADRA